MPDEGEKNDEEVTLNDMMKALNELKQDVKLNHERLTVLLNAVKAELKSEISSVRGQARENITSLENIWKEAEEIKQEQNIMKATLKSNTDHIQLRTFEK